MGFDVMAPEFEARCTRLLEASAGTGKTFAIQHLLTRLLISDPLIPLDRIALITFTKKATAALKERLRCNLEEAIEQLRSDRIDWPYLRHAVAEKSNKVILQRLLESLLHFDLLQVSTIHAFAALHLQRWGWQSCDSCEVDFVEKLVRLQLQALEHSSQHAHHVVQLLREDYSWSLDELVSDLARNLSTGLEIGASSGEQPAVSELLQALQDPAAAQLAELLEESANCFTGICYANGDLKYEMRQALETWQRAVQEGKVVDPKRLIYLIEALQPSQLKKRVEGEVLLASYMATWSRWLPTLRKLQARKSALESLARRIRQSLAPILQHDTRVGYDVLLRKLADRMKCPEIGRSIAQSLELLVVDEFQDTDPLQWQIVQQFAQHHPKLCLILVGDPKQSIYAFRQADIYTYLQARQFIQSRAGKLEQLDTNYRSHPRLVEALNRLFDCQQLSRWLYLPRTGESLLCPSVKPGRREQEGADPHLYLFKVSSGRAQQVEECAQVIAQTYGHFSSLGCTSFAALVSDHETSRLLSQALQTLQIPSCVQRPPPFSQLASTRIYALALRAWLDPTDSLAMQSFWSLPIWQIAPERLQEQLDVDRPGMEPFWQSVQRLHELLHEKGIGVFHEAWLKSPLPGLGDRVQNVLLRSEQGSAMLSQWRLLVSWMQEQERSLVAEQALDLIEALLEGDFDEQARYYAPSASSCVQIVTIHASKGLEYDVVYSLGTAQSSRPDTRWIQAYIEGAHRLVTHDGSGEELCFRQACDELDAEKARRLYVAWTRAKEYLLIAMPGTCQRVPGRGAATAFDLYRASWQMPEANGYGPLYEVIHKGVYSRFDQRLEELIQQGWAAHVEECSWRSGEPPALMEPMEASLPYVEPRTLARGPSQRLESFSSLVASRTMEGRFVEGALSSQHAAEALQSKSVADPLALLPKGKELGTVWHQLLQRALQLVKVGRALEQIQDRLQHSLLGTEFEEHALLLAQQTCRWLQQRWCVAGWEFSLLELPPSALRTEKQFSWIGEADLLLPEAAFHGVIDLLVIDSGHALFFDWKSNWLGDDRKEYTAETMIADAQRHRYDLQAHIYSRAIESYLQAVGGAELIGGVYVYLRGSGAILWQLDHFSAMELR